MTRFLMPLSDSVRLVEFAFANAQQGDIFVKKAPAATIGTLARALLDLFGADNEIRVTGSRHGEKLFETLVPAEELSRAEDLGEFYRIAHDSRDLNYDLYFAKGDVGRAAVADYDSQSTDRLDVEQTKQLLLALPEIRAELGAARAEG